MKDGFKVIDSDIHVIEPPDMFQKYVDPAFRDDVPAPVLDGGPVMWTFRDGVIPPYADKPERRRAWEIRRARAHEAARAEDREAVSQRMEVDPARRGTQPNEMLEAMDVEGIDIGIVFRTWAGHALTFDRIGPDLAGALCRSFNRWAAEFCSTDRDRLAFGALVPLHDPDIAVDEAGHAIDELGAVTIVLPSHPMNGKPIYDPGYDKLFAMIEERNVAVSFHGNHAAYGDHIGRRYLDNMVLAHAAGQPVELMLQLGAVLTGGVLARFPRLRMAFLEGNCAWLPWWLWALDERWEAWADHERFGSDRPSELFKRSCYVSVEPDESLARHVVDEIGDDNLVLSTDWPHDDSRYPHAIDTFLGHDGLGDDTKRKVLWENCARLYQLG